jgi:hypothetical protein
MLGIKENSKTITIAIIKVQTFFNVETGMFGSMFHHIFDGITHLLLHTTAAFRTVL